MSRLVGFLFLILSALNVNATALGEHQDYVQNDDDNLAMRSAVLGRRPNFAMHEIKGHTARIREYTSPQGIVFGVAWDGTQHPDLKPILGSYLKDFSDVAKVKAKTRGPGRHGADVVIGQHVVVERAGHMRGVLGKAYMREYLPEGVGVEDIK